ncbi:hypothetical protein [Sporosarcina limicola]|uniref:ABC-type multidrug transport system permease subunit n=1 Tax=Sporosarcina limicola TaxID=34101 RepID=A0A927MHZ2_9BACL|nr:hypothetical protein [Sporosarcina limicola]MBE1554990.1 ABC-type multidrug transport system permease subunit [Sporosarcina limicola]
MRIFYNECKKAFTSPIFIALLLLFAAFNIFVIVNSSDHKEELKVASELVEKYGRTITDQSLRQFEQDFQVELAELKKITGREYSSVYDFLDGLNHEDHELYDENEWLFINQLQLKEMYVSMAKDIDGNYARIDFKKFAEAEIEKYGLGGAAAKTLQHEYEEFSKRFEEMKQNGEHKEWFFAGKAYFMHSLLYRSVFMHIIIEALLLMVLSTALITNYEFENRTHLVAYATTRGRSLMKDKLAASLTMATSITIFLLAVTLGTFFVVFDYSTMWGTSISSAFNWEYQYPYVSWWDLSVGTFLVGVIVVVYVVMLLFSGLTFALSTLVKNSYITFFLMSSFFVIALLIPSFMLTSSNLLFITTHNLSSLVLNPHQLFMGSSGLTMFKTFELMTIGCWTMITMLFCIFSLKRFNKKDIQ